MSRSSFISNQKFFRPLNIIYINKIFFQREWNQSCEDSLSSSSGSEREPENSASGYPGLKMEQLKSALSRGAVTQNYDHLIRPDIQVNTKWLFITPQGVAVSTRQAFSLIDLLKILFFFNFRCSRFLNL